MSFNFFLNVKIFELNSKYTGHFFEEKKTSCRVELLTQLTKLD
jgi:hypothetical protein